MHESITCLNGDFMPASHASIPVSARAVRFGDGVFETIRISKGVACYWERHMARLNAGLIALAIPAPKANLQRIAAALLEKNALQEGFVRLSVSRGGGSAGYIPLAPQSPPVWWMECLPPRALPEGPFTLWQSGYHKIPPACLPAAQKLAQGINSTLALMEAAANSCDEALQLSATGHVASAAAGNLFWIAGDTLFTPALSTGCLNGITRQIVLETAPLPVTECEHTPDTLLAAEAVFITNTRLGAWPVAALKPRTHTWQNSHPVLAAIREGIEAHRCDYISKNSVHWKY